MELQPLLQIFGAVFILVGLATAMLFLGRIRKAKASRHWPTVAGELIQADLRRVEVEVTIRDHASALVTDFRYRYRVKGQDFEGRRVTFSDLVNKRKGSLERLLDEYRKQKSIRVYYNPENPGESVLKPGTSFYNFTPLITSLAFIACGLFIALYLPDLVSR